MSDEHHGSAEASELEDMFPLSYAVFAMARTHRALAAGELARLGLFPNQEIMLIQLAGADGLSQKTLAQTLKVSHPSVAKAVARMERAGLVARRPADDDKRVSLVSLTEAGRRLHDDIIALWRGLDEQTTAGLSVEERQAFIATSQKIRANLDR